MTAHEAKDWAILIILLLLTIGHLAKWGWQWIWFRAIWEKLKKREEKK